MKTIGRNETFQIEGVFFNEVGAAQEAPKEWASSDPSIITVDGNGWINTIGEGSAFISTSLINNGITFSDSIEIAVGDVTTFRETSGVGTIAPSSFYTLTGNFTVTQMGDAIQIVFADNYAASTSLPGLYIYLTNNVNSIGNALEIGRVQTFSGAHSYVIPNASVLDYSNILYFCKPFNVRIGDGAINIQ